MEKIYVNDYQFLVIGNLPYIKYRSLDKEDRDAIRETFSACHLGKFDYCYAFIQKSIDSLKKNGRMAYLVPSSIFKMCLQKNNMESIKLLFI